MTYSDLFVFFLSSLEEISWITNTFYYNDFAKVIRVIKIEAERVKSAQEKKEKAEIIQFKERALREENL